MAKKENFKNSYTNKIKQNLEFFTEYEYIYKKNKLFNQLSLENQDLYHHSKTNKKLTNKDYKKLYDRAINISYGIDHIADTVGLFTRKIKTPVLSDTSILKVKFDQNDSHNIDFICGDLYLRKNVILKKDNLQCYKSFSKIVDKLNNKLIRFSWQMSYEMPVSKKEIKKLIETQTTKHCLQTGPIWIYTINYNLNLGDIFNKPKKKDNILYLTSDLIWTDLKAILKLTKKLKNLKKICFVNYSIAWQPRRFNHKKGLGNYIIEICNNPNFEWSSLAPRLNNSKHLNKLKNFRKNIDKSIKIEFLNSEYDFEYDIFYKDNCQKILRDANVIEN